jgi:hypothetical protein
LNKTHGYAFGALVALSTIGPVEAGVYADDMARCLVERTTQDDRLALVRWMFSAAAAHPAVESIARVTPEQLDASNKAVAELFVKLMTETCREQTTKALRYEGPSTMQLSFQVLGQVAGNELFSSPEVAKAMSGLEKYADNSKIQALTQD